MKIFFGILLLVATVLTDVTGECELARFYQELRCRPEPSTNNATDCPLSYTCPDYPDPTKCYYKGTAFSDEERIPQSLVEHPCSQQCVCHVRPYGYFRMFQCLAIDCMEAFAWFNPDNKCISTRDLNSCCSGRICDADAIAKLKTCEFEGRTYKEGQSFYPKNTSKMCVCTAQWNGSIDSQDCRDINCGLEIYHQDNIRKNCAPVFFGNQRSCPIYFTCPSGDTTVIRTRRSQRGRPQCVFGDQILSVGDELRTHDNCTTCKCSVPPFVSCTKTNC